MPAEIREKLRLKPGDTVIWGEGPHGEATVRPVKYTFEELRGIVPAIDTDQDLLTIMDEALEEWREYKVREFEELGK